MCGAATTPQTWVEGPNAYDLGDGGNTYTSNNPNFAGVTESITADGDTRVLTHGSQPANFSVTGRNWNIHNGAQDPWISGYRPGGDNPNMSGNMLGHVGSVDAEGNITNPNYDNYEDNYYQIDGIVLHADLTDIQLMFDYDSWIESDIDGFAVAFDFDGGTSFELLDTFTMDSDMDYRNLGSSDQSLNNLVGESGDVIGFDGNAGGEMAGTAMFNLSTVGAAGQTLSLRFAFASNGSSHQEGINIDNIKVTGICDPGSPDCDPPGTGAPEPGSLALALLGLTAVYRQRKKTR